MRGSFYLISKYGAGEVWIMEGLDLSKNDIPALLLIADCFARMGSIVKILTPVHFKSELYNIVYGGLIGTRYERKWDHLQNPVSEEGAFFFGLKSAGAKVPNRLCIIQIASHCEG